MRCRLAHANVFAMRPVLLVTDGSPSAAGAQDAALELARRLGVPLVAASVVHVTLPVVGYGVYGYSALLSDLQKAERERVRNLLAEVAAAAGEAGVTCRTIIGNGPVVDEVCHIATKEDAEMIVVGSHGWGAGRRLVFGSISSGLLRAAPRPVLVVRGTDSHSKLAAA
jgi:nucleotide-binding universal stress UspA family protein